jgi:uncharacterized GH25 family protein
MSRRPFRAALFAALTALGCASASGAHEFWVQPNDYWLRPSQATTAVTLQVGLGPERQRSAISLSRITRFEMVAPGGASIDLRADLHPGGPAKDGDLGFGAPGAYVVVLETDDRAQSRLPASRFNDYLKTEGLTPALEERARTHRMNTDGSETYSRRTKAIVQVGPPSEDSQAQVTRPLGLPLEIVPEVNPYAARPAGALPVKVIYEGQPLAGALVSFTDLDHDAEPFETRLTDAEGRARFTMPKHGRWLLNVVWTKPLPASANTDFETVFSSLSFGFPVTDAAPSAGRPTGTVHRSGGTRR